MRQGRNAWQTAIAVGLLSLFNGLHAEDSAPSGSDESLVTVAYAVADLLVPISDSKAVGDATADFESLIDLIELRTGGDCWKDSGGHGAITTHDATSTLIIRQTESVHERIRDLLTELRKTADLAVRFEVSIFEGELPTCSSCGTPGDSPFGLVDDNGRQRIVEQVLECPDVKQLSAPSLLMFDGQSASIVTHNEASSLELEIRGLVSDDHRYLRMRVRSDVDGAETHTECLIPDGYTAVRELIPQQTWAMITPHIINSNEPEEVLPTPLAAQPILHSGPRFLVPAEDLPTVEGMAAIQLYMSDAEPSGYIEQVAGNAELPDDFTPAPLPEPQPAAPAKSEQKEPTRAVPQRTASEKDDRTSASVGPTLKILPGRLAIRNFSVAPDGLIAPPQNVPGADLRSAESIGATLTLTASVVPVKKSAFVPPSPDETASSIIDLGVINNSESNGIFSGVVIDRRTNDDCGTPGYAGVISVRPAPTVTAALPESNDSDCGQKRAWGAIWQPVLPPVCLTRTPQLPSVSPQPAPRKLPTTTAPATPLAQVDGVKVVISPNGQHLVEQASAEVTTNDIQSRLKEIEQQLQSAGLTAEAQQILKVRQDLNNAAAARIKELDLEIERLNVEKARLEEVSRLRGFVFGGVEILR